MNSSKKTFDDYSNSDKLWKFFSRIIKIARSYITRV